ncbi:unnamed protein product [Musa acuminata subsp. burmannicoides]
MFLILQSLVLDFIPGKEDISSEVGAPKARSLGFLPRKRASRHRGKVLSFPRMTQQNPCKLTAFLGYNSGMTTRTVSVC